ncbi:MAG: hypothetical protein P8X90_02785 [Desulfobacterales bacterium]
MIEVLDKGPGPLADPTVVDRVAGLPFELDNPTVCDRGQHSGLQPAAKAQRSFDIRIFFLHFRTLISL